MLKRREEKRKDIKSEWEGVARLVLTDSWVIDNPCESWRDTEVLTDLKAFLVRYSSTDAFHFIYFW